MRASRFRFVHVSTDEVYGSLGTTGRFREDTPYQPSSPYSASKAASDHLAHAWYKTYGLPIIVSNCSNNYGPYQFPEKLIPLTILNALDCKSLPVYGKGTNVRDWLHVDDHARGLIMLLERGQPGEKYNFGGDSERTNLSVVELICDILDRLSPVERPRRSLIRFVTDRPGHDLRYAIDASKARQQLGWSPQESFESGLERTIRWYLQNTAWWQPIREQVYGGERLGLAAWRARKKNRMRPILVAGTTGQLARSLVDVGEQRAIPIVAVSRPELDLENADSIDRVVRAVLPGPSSMRQHIRPSTWQNRSRNAHSQLIATAPDGSQQRRDAFGFRLSMFRPIMSLMAARRLPIAKDDDPCPLGAYGQSKLEGEKAVMAANPDAIVFRTSWVYSPYGTNFLKTMLRLAETRDVVRVVDDQHGAPTAAIDLAGAIVDALMQVLERGARGRAGIYHVTAAGETTWYGFAKAIFAGWRDRGHRVPQLEAITTADYPTRVKRPANSRLDCQKFQRVFGICLPPWSTSLGPCLDVLADARREVQL